MNNQCVIALLQNAQAQRHHWSSMINSMNGFLVVVLVGIWAYFIPAYIQSFNNTNNGGFPAYLFVGSAISALTLGIWRIYARYIDGKIAGLFPGIFLYEQRLGTSKFDGISGYLHENKQLRKIIDDADMSLTRKTDVLRKIVEKKKIGNRKHLLLDIAATLMTFCMIILTIVSRLYVIVTSQNVGWKEALPKIYIPIDVQTILYIICTVCMVFGFIAVAFIAPLSFQRNPSVVFRIWPYNTPASDVAARSASSPCRRGLW